MYRLIHDGAFEAVMVGSRWRVRESDLKRYVKRLPNAMPVDLSVADDDLKYTLEHLEQTGEFPKYNLNIAAKHPETP